MSEYKAFYFAYITFLLLLPPPLLQQLNMEVFEKYYEKNVCFHRILCTPMFPSTYPRTYYETQKKGKHDCIVVLAMK